MRKIWLVICCCFILCTNVFAQAQSGKLSPLDKLMQDNADTTIVFQYTSNWMGPPSRFFLSKKGDSLNAYTYRDLATERWRKVPHNIRHAMFMVNKFKIMTVPEEVNEFFRIFPISDEWISKFWSDVIALKPWAIKDDDTDGTGCPLVKREDGLIVDNDVYDGGGIRLLLITKDEVKALDFYAPGFYEQHCPGRAGRIAVLKISDLFNSYLP